MKPTIALTILTGALLSGMPCPVAYGQAAPDIVWKTNAHSGIVNAVAISPDSTLVASASDDRTVQVRRVTDGVLVYRLTNHVWVVHGVAFSPNGQHLATAGDTTWRLWRVTDGTEVLAHISDGEVFSVAFSPDSTILAASEGYYYARIRLYYVPSGVFVRQIGASPTAFRSLVFSPDGGVIAESQIATSGTRLVDVLNGTWRLQVRWPVNCRFSPDGQFLVGAGAAFPGGPVEGRFIGIVTTSDGSLDRILEGHEDGVLAVEYFPNGKVLLSSSLDNTIRLWRIASRKAIRVYDQETQGAGPIAMAPNGRFFAYGRRDGTVAVARVPVFISHIQRQGARTIIEWEGGTGNYQVQQCTDLSNGLWENLGALTTDTSFTNQVGGAGCVFYRVQNLAD